MEPPLSRLVLLCFGLLFTIFADFVESQSSDTSPSHSSPSSSPHPHPPPPLSPPKSQPPLTPTSAPSRPPLHPPLRPPPPAKRGKNTTNRRPPPPSPPQLHDDKLNTGKMIGLLFIGIVIILQICVVGFLVFKRRQLLKVKSTYETFSSSS